MNFHESLIILLFKNIHEPFKNTLMNVHELSLFFVHKDSWTIHKCDVYHEFE